MTWPGQGGSTLVAKSMCGEKKKSCPEITIYEVNLASACEKKSSPEFTNAERKSLVLRFTYYEVWKK